MSSSYYSREFKDKHCNMYQKKKQNKLLFNGHLTLQGSLCQIPLHREKSVFMEQAGII